jgi:hypothetical protein
LAHVAQLGALQLRQPIAQAVVLFPQTLDLFLRYGG